MTSRLGLWNVATWRLGVSNIKWLAVGHLAMTFSYLVKTSFSDDAKNIQLWRVAHSGNYCCAKMSQSPTAPICSAREGFLVLKLMFRALHCWLLVGTVIPFAVGFVARHFCISCYNKNFHKYHVKQEIYDDSSIRMIAKKNNNNNNIDEWKNFFFFPE